MEQTRDGLLTPDSALDMCRQTYHIDRCMEAKVVPFGLPRPVAEELVHRLASEGRFVLEPACKEKLLDRGFSVKQVNVTMECGHINQGPTRDECGDYRCRIRKRVAGRLVRVVIAIHNMNFLYVISVH
jgi:hypothetical protein